MELGAVSSGSQLTSLHHKTSVPKIPSINSTLNNSSYPTLNTLIPKRHLFLITRSGPLRTHPIQATCVAQESYEKRESFYDLLGIPVGGTLSEIKQAYKLLARKYHPDVSPPDCSKENTKKFMEVKEAYETLSDPNRRALYDIHLATGFHLVFTSRIHEKVWDEKSEWRNQWQSQLEGLKRKSLNKNLGENMSWADKMRKQRVEEDID